MSELQNIRERVSRVEKELSDVVVALAEIEREKPPGGLSVEPPPDYRGVAHLSVGSVYQVYTDDFTFAGEMRCLGRSEDILWFGERIERYSDCVIPVSIRYEGTTVLLDKGFSYRLGSTFHTDSDTEVWDCFEQDWKPAAQYAQGTVERLYRRRNQKKLVRRTQEFDGQKKRAAKFADDNRTVSNLKLPLYRYSMGNLYELTLDDNCRRAVLIWRHCGPENIAYSVVWREGAGSDSE